MTFNDLFPPRCIECESKLTDEDISEAAIPGTCLQCQARAWHDPQSGPWMAITEDDE